MGCSAPCRKVTSKGKRLHACAVIVRAGKCSSGNTQQSKQLEAPCQVVDVAALSKGAVGRAEVRG
jgi:hypothetical protein